MNNNAIPRKFVLDTNCLIDIEDKRENEPHIRTLITAWRNGKLELAVVAVSASENQKGGSAAPSYRDFEEKLHRVGLTDVPHLLPLAIWDVSYWDRALWSSDETEQLASRIRSVLFPNMTDTPTSDDMNEKSKWRNQMCDVMVAWSCIHHEWSCLVTNDGRFHTYKHELATLGLRDVLRPVEAATLYGLA